MRVVETFLCTLIVGIVGRYIFGEPFITVMILMCIPTLIFIVYDWFLFTAMLRRWERESVELTFPHCSHCTESCRVYHHRPCRACGDK